MPPQDKGTFISFSLGCIVGKWIVIKMLDFPTVLESWRRLGHESLYMGQDCKLNVWVQNHSILGLLQMAKLQFSRHSDPDGSASKCVIVLPGCNQNECHS